jgi:hypothetical protein
MEEVDRLIREHYGLIEAQEDAPENTAAPAGNIPDEDDAE